MDDTVWDDSSDEESDEVEKILPPLWDAKDQCFLQDAKFSWANLQSFFSRCKEQILVSFEGFGQIVYEIGPLLLSRIWT